jgi:hypothetical protein
MQVQGQAAGAIGCINVVPHADHQLMVPWLPPTHIVCSFVAATGTHEQRLGYRWLNSTRQPPTAA